MKIKELNDLNIIIDKKLELMLAIHAVYLKNHSEARDELDFIETPPIEYLNELETLLNSVIHQELIDAILEFTDESICVEIALSLDGNYEIDINRANLEKISKYIGNVSLTDFVNEFRSFAIKIKWDEFFSKHNDFYLKLFSSFCDFPESLDFSDIERFYGQKARSYNYIPSILMNGGFSYSDKLGNLYYIRGIQWSKEKKKFHYDKEYLLECMFHEFSHPIINPLVEKYFTLFTNLDDFYQEALKHGLPTTYNSKKVLLYEYFVRANANILTRKYYHNARVGSWILQHGFVYLNDIIDCTIQKKTEYKNYEELFKIELISTVNDILKSKQKD